MTDSDADIVETYNNAIRDWISAILRRIVHGVAIDFMRLCNHSIGRDY